MKEIFPTQAGGSKSAPPWEGKHVATRAGAAPAPSLLSKCPWVLKAAALPLRCLETTASCTVLTQLEKLQDTQCWPSSVKLQSGPFVPENSNWPFLLIPHENCFLLPCCSGESRAPTASAIQVVQVSKNKIKSNLFNLFQFCSSEAEVTKGSDSPALPSRCAIWYFVCLAPQGITPGGSRVLETEGLEPFYSLRWVNSTASNNIPVLCSGLQEKNSFKELFILFYLTSPLPIKCKVWTNDRMAISGKSPWVMRTVGPLGSQAERRDWWAQPATLLPVFRGSVANQCFLLEII